MTRTRDEIQRAVFDALGAVAPEADPTRLDRSAVLRDALDIDSMDFLSFVTALHKALGVDVPEKDYPKIQTLAGCVDYLAQRLGA